MRVKTRKLLPSTKQWGCCQMLQTVVIVGNQGEPRYVPGSGLQDRRPFIESLLICCKFDLVHCLSRGASGLIPIASEDRSEHEEGEDDPAQYVKNYHAACGTTFRGQRALAKCCSTYHDKIIRKTMGGRFKRSIFSRCTDTEILGCSGVR